MTRFLFRVRTFRYFASPAAPLRFRRRKSRTIFRPGGSGKRESIGCGGIRRATWNVNRVAPINPRRGMNEPSCPIPVAPSRRPRAWPGRRTNEHATHARTNVRTHARTVRTHVRTQARKHARTHARSNACKHADARTHAHVRTSM